MNNPIRHDRDHLFVSYAWEDVAFVEWLVYRLTALGYRVWCDRVKIFGGESFPTDIDDAIKNRTYRFLAVMSHHSVNKPNPRKERTIAHGISKERQNNFIIPLNLGLGPTELDWMTSDLTYVDFRNWAQGLANLVKAIRKAGTPCPLQNGRDLVCGTQLPAEIVVKKPEVISSNLLRVERIPAAISVVRFRHSLDGLVRRRLRDTWAHHPLEHTGRFLAFQKPPTDLHHEICDAHLWEGVDRIENLRTQDLVAELLRKTLNCHCVARGLMWDVERRWLYFPFGLVEGNRVPFTNLDGKKISIKICGERTFFTPGKPSRYRYYLSPTFRIMRDFSSESFVVRFRLRIRITDSIGKTLPDVAAQARRKHVSRDWWNHEWASRYLAFCSFLADGKEEIVVGDQDQYRVVFSGRPTLFVSQLSLNEAKLEERIKGRKMRTV